MNKKTEQISHLIKLNISEIDPQAKVILYGSRARGDARKDSDWNTRQHITPYYRNVTSQGIQL